MQPRLAALAGPNKGQIYELNEETVAVGRESANHIALNHPSVSRRHCVLRRTGDSFIINDLDSLNGTWVGDEPARDRWLRHGDRVRVGDYLFVFLLDDEPTSSRVALHAGSQWEGANTMRLRVAEAFHLMARDLSALMKISTRINALHGLDELQKELLEQIFEVVPAQRGAILLLEEGAEEDAAAFGLERGAGAAATVNINLAVVRQVVREGVALMSHDAPAAPDGDTPAALLCVPLTLAEKTLGALYLDTDDPAARFDRDHLQLLTAIAGIAAVALNNARYVAWLEEENQRLRAESLGENNIIGESPAVQKVVKFIARVAPTSSTVLIRGESGTGKELAARALHLNSARRDRPFVALNCAALTETLLESELFGYEKGAFTGAQTQRKGKLEAAHEGTLFLDEIGELALLLQAKLLRVLQEREFERVGGTRPVRVDLRLVAATNRDLEAEVKAGRFRADLYYRLNVVQFVMPALRERGADVQLLADYFVQKYRVVIGRPVRGISAAARKLLRQYDWPGNVRELENAVERAVVLGGTELIQPEDLPETLLETETAPATGAPARGYHDVLNETKKQLIRSALTEAQGSYVEAARLLGLHPNYLHRLIRNLHLKDQLP